MGADYRLGSGRRCAARPKGRIASKCVRRVTHTVMPDEVLLVAVITCALIYLPFLPRVRTARTPASNRSAIKAEQVSSSINTAARLRRRRAALAPVHTDSRRSRGGNTSHALSSCRKKNPNRTFRSLCFNAYVTPAAGACSTESAYPNRRRRSWRQPFFNQRSQRPFCRVHPLLLQSRCRRLPVVL
jgi:hypothetical protein